MIAFLIDINFSSTHTVVYIVYKLDEIIGRTHYSVAGAKTLKVLSPTHSKILSD